MDGRKYGRTYHFPFSEGATNDDRIQFDWLGLFEGDVVMSEKLDGENTCIKSDGVYARSHAAPTVNPWAKNMLPIWERLKYDLDDLEIFGENLYGIHSIEYEHLPDYFFVFAIRQGDFWLSWEEVCSYCFLLDLKVVPVILIGTIINPIKAVPNIIAEQLALGSAFGGVCEGYVFRNKTSFHIDDFSKNVLKYVRKNHVQTDTHWTKNWKQAKLSMVDFVPRKTRL
jgi:RNA ligase